MAAIILLARIGIGAPLASAATLEDCVAAALADSPNARAADQRARAARESLLQARSAYYPQLKTSANWARTDNPPQAFFMNLNQRQASLQNNFNEPDDTENLRLSAGVAYRLFDGGRRGMDLVMAREGSMAQTALRDSAYNQLVFDVTRNFFNVLQARAFVGVQQESVSNLTESLRVARERFSAGSAVKTDVLNLEVKLAEANEELIRARNAHRLAVAALNTAIGRDLIPADENLVAPGRDPAPGPVDDDVARRGEWRAARALRQMKEAAWRKAVREYGPTVSAFGSLDWDSDVSPDFENSYLVGAMAELDVFDGFRRRGGTAAAKAEYEAALADEARAGNQLRLDMKQADLQANEARERRDVAAKIIESA
jgi:outer membrane protein TolC